MATRKKTTVWERVITRINFNTILMALIGGYFSFMGLKMNSKQNEAKEKIDSTATKQDSSNIRQMSWRKRSDSVYNKIFIGDSIQNIKLDSILTILKK